MKVFDILFPEFLMLYDPLIVAFDRTKLIAAPGAHLPRHYVSDAFSDAICVIVLKNTLSAR